MPGDPTAAILQAWEDGRKASPGERGLLLLGVARPELTAAAQAGSTVGQRDAALLDLFERLFGAAAPALADCPRCAEPLETDVPIAAIRVQAPAAAPDRFTLTFDGRTIAYRLPTAGDLAALGAAAPDGNAAALTSWLARRCTLSAEDRDRTALVAKETGFSQDVLTALGTAIAEAVATHDPQAEVRLALDCPSCGFHWSAPFDIVEFLWRRLDGFVSGVLREVHILASAYGWSERDILALSPARRRLYTELIGT
jgi:hypothetical protein